uniref:Vps54 domain-containing protein n=1 Tax=Schistosoma mansoni TaxID=6183 RepID=A0A3Q0KDE9_SCHMA
MDLFARAPLAPFEGGGVYDDFDGSETSSLVAETDHQIKRVSSIPFDASFSFEDSLTDLIGNFDERIYHCFENFDVDPENARRGDFSGNVPTLSDVKQWWAAATRELVPTESYPLRNLPSNVNLYDLDQFELADADGITEDGVIKTSLLQTSSALNYSNESIYSGRGTVTTLSLSSVSVSPRSLTLDRGFPNTFAQIPDSGISNTDEELNGYFKDFDDENILEVFQSHHPSLPLKKTQSWVDDLQNLKTSVLKLYAQQMNDEIMQLSDCLVDSLAERDELLMLREASDDFIILLNLVHERKTQASKAALLATAKSLIRSKTLFRVTTPWFTKRPHISASSTLSLVGSSNIEKPGTTPLIRNESNGHVPVNSVHLDLQNNSVAYVVSLNLHSKLRRPRTQPIHVHRTNNSDVKSVSNSVNSIGSKQLNESHLSERADLSSESIKSIPTRQAKIRYEALVNLCNSTNWPNGKPQNSRSLLLCIPYRIKPGVGISIQDLRLLNQILYAAVLENPKIEKLLESYIMNVTNSNDIVNWIKTVEPLRCYDAQKLNGVSCQNQHRSHLLSTSMQTQCA